MVSQRQRSIGPLDLIFRRTLVDPEFGIQVRLILQSVAKELIEQMTHIHVEGLEEQQTCCLSPLALPSSVQIRYSSQSSESVPSWSIVGRGCLDIVRASYERNT